MARSARHGFTLFEVLVGMFVLLVGLLGVVSMFSFGVQMRLQAQEMIAAQDLANMWSDWIRSRINDTKPGGGAVLHRADLQEGKQGDFYLGTGDFCTGGGSINDLPTYQCSSYRGYKWEITKVNHNYKPRWMPTDTAQAPIAWDTRLDSSGLFPAGMTGAGTLTELEMSIFRGARRYKFRFIFSGVGLRHARS